MVPSEECETFEYVCDEEIVPDEACMQECKTNYNELQAIRGNNIAFDLIVLESQSEFTDHWMKLKTQLAPVYNFLNAYSANPQITVILESLS
jgi:hypothetical protein